MHKLKNILRNFSLIRLENLSVPGTPDLLVYNNFRHFFTIELKVTKTNKITFSPHQIAFHVKHPVNTFILVIDARCRLPKLYEGSRIRELEACGLEAWPPDPGFFLIVRNICHRLATPQSAQHNHSLDNEEGA